MYTVIRLTLTVLSVFALTVTCSPAFMLLAVVIRTGLANFVVCGLNNVLKFFSVLTILAWVAVVVVGPTWLISVPLVLTLIFVRVQARFRGWSLATGGLPVSERGRCVVDTV